MNLQNTRTSISSIRYLSVSGFRELTGGKLLISGKLSAERAFDSAGELRVHALHSGMQTLIIEEVVLPMEIVCSNVGSALAISLLHSFPLSFKRLVSDC